MLEIIVRSPSPIVLLGGAQIAPEVLNILQSYTTTFVAADGGAAHLLKTGLKPQAIIGDMDSVSAVVRQAFGDVFHPFDDQNTTDFQKAMQRIESPVILSVGFLGGRLDHTLSVLNTIARDALINVILVSEDDVCFLARPKATRLSLPIATRIGLLPLGDVRITTHGLRWDIDDAVMALDGFISTSNETAQNDVTIQATGKLLITLPLSALDIAIGVVHAK